jgi:hypothetical protein
MAGCSWNDARLAVNRRVFRQMAGGWQDARSRDKIASCLIERTASPGIGGASDPCPAEKSLLTHARNLGAAASCKKACAGWCAAQWSVTSDRALCSRMGCFAIGCAIIRSRRVNVLDLEATSCGQLLARSWRVLLLPPGGKSYPKLRYIVSDLHCCPTTIVTA